MYIWVEDTKDFHLAKFITKEKIILSGVVEKRFFYQLTGPTIYFESVKHNYKQR